MESLKQFITAKLNLKVSEQKSGVALPWSWRSLGFSFTSAGTKAADSVESGGPVQGAGTGPDAPDERGEHSTDGRGSKPVLASWIGYFGKCETPSVLAALEWRLRRRLRSAIWKQWKRGTTRYAELRKRGVKRDLAAKTAGSGHGPWRLADSPGLHIALPNAYFESLGIPRLTVR